MLTSKFNSSVPSDLSFFFHDVCVIFINRYMRKHNAKASKKSMEQEACNHSEFPNVKTH